MLRSALVHVLLMELCTFVRQYICAVLVLLVISCTQVLG